MMFLIKKRLISLFLLLNMVPGAVVYGMEKKHMRSRAEAEQQANAPTPSIPTTQPNSETQERIATLATAPSDEDPQRNETPTPDLKNATPEQATTTTIYAKVPITNYCAMILDAVKQGDAAGNDAAQIKAAYTQINTAFANFFSEIPYGIQNIHKKDATPGNIINHTKKFYYALCFTLCQCLEQCAATTPTLVTEAETKTKIIGRAPTPSTSTATATEPDVIYLPLKCNNTIYVLQFFVCEGEPKIDNYQRFHYINNGSDQNIKTFYINIVLDSNGDFAGLKNRMPTATPSTATTSTTAEATLQDKDVNPLDMNTATPYIENNIYTEAIDDLNDAVVGTEKLSILFQQLITNLVSTKTTTTLPTDLKPVNEKFFRNLCAHALRFVGLGHVETERETLRGRIDLLLYQAKEDAPVLIFEFKFNGNVEDASKQCQDRAYNTITTGKTTYIEVNLRESTWGVEIGSNPNEPTTHPAVNATPSKLNAISSGATLDRLRQGQSIFAPHTPNNIDQTDSPIKNGSIGRKRIHFSPLNKS